MSLLEICERLETTWLAVLIQESRYGFPLVVGIHILGLTLSVGTLLWVDLRMAGVALRRARVTEVYHALAPWFLVGFTVMLLSGAVLFTAFASSAYANVYFRLKVAAIVLAGVNAFAFHFLIARTSGAWDARERPPAAARISGIASLVLWASVVVAGRMMSYTMF